MLQKYSFCKVNVTKDLSEVFKTELNGRDKYSI